MSVRQQLSIKKWGRTVSFLDGEAGLQFPADSLNAKLHGLTYKPRDGYNEVAITPSGPGDTYALRGLGHVVSSKGQSEFISIEKRNGTANAYTINDTTMVRSDHGLASDTELNDGKWIVTSFDEQSYLINFDSLEDTPLAKKRVWRHKIGTSSDLVAIEDQNYVAPPSDPELTITRNDLEVIRTWVAAPTDTYSYPIWVNTHNHSYISVAIGTGADDGCAIFSGANDDHGPNGGRLQIQCLFGAASDLSGNDYLSFTVTGLEDLRTLFPASTVPEFHYGGTWHAAAGGAKWYVEGTKDGTYIMNVEGMTLTAVDGFRFTVDYDPERAKSGPSHFLPFLRVSPLMGGGVYLASANATHRIWTTPRDTLSKGISYGVQYGDATFAVTSNISQGTISNDETYGYYASPLSTPAGGNIVLSAEAPDGVIYSKLRFLRLDNSVSPAKWKILSVNTAGPWVFKDTYREYQIHALTDAQDGTSPAVSPSFHTAGIRFAFPFKQSMIWLTKGGVGNIQISQVGEPEKLYDSEQTPDDNDLTQAAQRTLADNLSDQPVWGVQAGANAFIVGEKAAYALQGDFPVSLSPSRQIPGSRGIVGPYAGCRFRPTGGQDGATYLDEEGNVWLVNSVPEFTNDTRAKPFELSSLVRHKIRQFLYTDQLGEFPELTMADALLEFQEATSSLWVIMGKRAAVYRQDDSGSGWEFYEYQLTTPPGMEENSTCRDFTAGVATPLSIDRSGSTHVWGNPAFGAVVDGNEASAGAMTYNDKTALLRSPSIAPSTLLPISATLDGIHVRIRHRKEGDIGITHDWTKMTVNDTPVGSDIALDEVVATTPDTVEYEITTGLPSVADINDGKVGFEIGYVAETGNPAWNDPANYHIWVTKVVPPPDPGDSLTATATIHVHYLLGGPKPPSIDLMVTASGLVRPDGYAKGVDGSHYSYYLGEGTITDGLGHTATGSMYSRDDGDIFVTISNAQPMHLVLSDGDATTTLTSHASIAHYGASFGIWMDYNVLASMIVKAPSTVFVDSMEIKYCYTVIAASEGADSGISWQRVCFTPDSKYLAGRSSGQFDLVEYDFRNGAFINGMGRDGGYPMPDWFLTLERMTFEGRTARLCGVQVNTLDPADEFNVAGRVGSGSFVPATSTGTASSRWVRFPVTQIGISHQVKIAGDEAVDGIDGLAIEYQITSRSKV